jgi:hypothetical protein
VTLPTYGPNREEKQSSIFRLFQRKNALISTTREFSTIGNSMVTSKNYVLPRRDAMHDHEGMTKIKIRGHRAIWYQIEANDK